MEEMVCTASSIFYIGSALEISVNQTNMKCNIVKIGQKWKKYQLEVVFFKKKNYFCKKIQLT